MEITIPKVVRPLSLNEYISEIGDKVFQVWVNPTRTTRSKIAGLHANIRILILAMKEIDARFAKKKDASESEINKVRAQVEELSGKIGALLLERDEWVSEILSQGSEESKISPAEVTRMRTETLDADPRFFEWLVGRISAMIDEYRSGIKKA
jgi:hypothetical protein